MSFAIRSTYKAPKKEDNKPASLLEVGGAVGSVGSAARFGRAAAVAGPAIRPSRVSTGSGKSSKSVQPDFY